MGHTSRMNIGERLQYFRKRAQKKQEVLAAEAGVTRATVVSIENGRSSPTIATLRALLKACNVTLEEFFQAYGPPNISDEDGDLHRKLQAILRDDLKAREGIIVNIEYLYGHMVTLMQEKIVDGAKEVRAKRAREQVSAKQRTA